MSHVSLKIMHLKLELRLHLSGTNALDSKVHVANMGPIWGQQDPGGTHFGPMNLISAEFSRSQFLLSQNKQSRLRYALVMDDIDIFLLRRTLLHCRQDTSIVIFVVADGYESIYS